MVSKGYGLTVSEIDSSCPADLQPYADAYILERKQRDTEAWMQWGAYGLSAVGTAIERNLAGKNQGLNILNIRLWVDLWAVQRIQMQNLARNALFMR